MRERYKIVIRNNGLREYDREQVKYVFESSSAKDAVRRVKCVYTNAERNGRRISYYAKQFLEAVAISAETDIAEVK